MYYLIKETLGPKGRHEWGRDESGPKGAAAVLVIFGFALAVIWAQVYISRGGILTWPTSKRFLGLAV